MSGDVIAERKENRKRWATKQHRSRDAVGRGVFARFSEFVEQTHPPHCRQDGLTD